MELKKNQGLTVIRRKLVGHLLITYREVQAEKGNFSSILFIRAYLSRREKVR